MLNRFGSASAKAARTAADALRAELAAADLAALVKARVFEGTPHVFSSDPPKYETLRKHLADELGVDSTGVRVVGSAKTGFSMSPDSFGRQFLPNSDVDVVVVSDSLFDQVWSLLLQWRYPWHLRKWGDERLWGTTLAEALVCGWFDPAAIEPPTLTRRENSTPLRDIAWKWVNAFQSVGGLHPELSGRHFTGRLYRTWDHAVIYHVSGFKAVVDRDRQATETD